VCNDPQSSYECVRLLIWELRGRVDRKTDEKKKKGDDYTRRLQSTQEVSNKGHTS